MSLAIDVDKVDMVLLLDGWHEVAGDSFDVDATSMSTMGPSC